MQFYLLPNRTATVAETAGRLSTMQFLIFSNLLATETVLFEFHTISHASFKFEIHVIPYVFWGQLTVHV